MELMPPEHSVETFYAMKGGVIVRTYFPNRASLVVVPISLGACEREPRKVYLCHDFLSSSSYRTPFVDCLIYPRSCERANELGPDVINL
jgi:hypothetical protein